jgi:hypothetical protein
MLQEQLQDEPIYPTRYLELQLIFARKVAASLDIPLAMALLEYTALYKILGIPGDFDAQQTAWQAALLVCTHDDAATRLHVLYRSRLDVIPKFTDGPHWGCFAYEFRAHYGLHTQVIHIHFSNQDRSGAGALSHERMQIRLAELREMFTQVARAEPQATTVCGGSWLYNWPAYRRLFPPAYGASVVPDEPHYQFRALWGQFLRHDWTVNETTAAHFLARVATLTEHASDAEIAACFPYQVLLTACPIEEFYAFYSIADIAGESNPSLSAP